MSDSSKGGGEPSMEEILASIRKIISEDTADDGQKAAAGGDGEDAARPSPAGAADTAGLGDDVLELSDEAAPDDDTSTDADSGDDAPLDLTEEVQTASDATAPDDDQPLELDDEVDDPADMPAQAPTEIAGAADSLADGDDGAAPDGAAGDEPDSAHDLENPDLGPDIGPDIGPDPDAYAGDDATPFLADPFDDAAAGGDAPDTAAEAALAAGAMAGAGGATAGGSTAGGAGASSRRSADTASPLGPEDQRVISDSAEQQAVEQLTSLARQAENAPGDSTADNVDHILARMVRDALRPQLREWMDRNLPQIVERIVREEVQRMTRRAQGLDDDSRY